MQWKKVGVVVVLIISLFLVSCSTDPGPSAGQIWEKIVHIGTLGFLCKSGLFGTCNYEDNLVAFMRILVGILVFALLYVGASAIPGLSENRNVSIAVCIILAIMSVIFIPGSVLAGIGAAYATLIASVLIGAPIVGGLLLFRMIPGDTKGGVLLRIVVLFILLAVLIGVKEQASELLSPGLLGGLF
ncbi:MAG TPA: hypothetical protein VJA18_05610 [Candidatus Nanoarchaeia archaeon]|nr:hypothetical protein [Candidatus Nanoarchaeia archaeon]